MLAKILGTTLAATVFATAAGGSVLADSRTTTGTPSTKPAATAPADRTNQRAIDALRDVLDRMVDEHKLTAKQSDAVIDAAKRADWDGFSVERLGDILMALVRHDVISIRDRDAILDAVRHSDRMTFRFVAVLDRLTANGTLSRDQNDAIRDTLHKADWDGFSIERLGDIIGGLVQTGVLSAAQRDAILDGMRR